MMRVEIFHSEDDQKAAELSNTMHSFEMPAPPNIGDFVRWVVVEGDDRKGRMWFLSFVVTRRVFYVDQRDASVICELYVRSLTRSRWHRDESWLVVGAC